MRKVERSSTCEGEPANLQSCSQGGTGELGEVVRSGFEVCKTGGQPWRVVSEFGEAHFASVQATKTSLFKSESYLPQVVGHVVGSTQQNAQSVPRRIFGIVFFGHCFVPLQPFV